jgi:hypothetical protein
MKTTIDLPDDLYALVKARAALEGRTLRSVMEELLKGWVVGGAQAGTGAREHRGKEAEGQRRGEEKGEENEGGRTKNEGGLKRVVGGARAGYGKQVKEGTGAAEGGSNPLQPWEVLMMKWKKAHNPRASVESVAGCLKGSGPDLDLAKAREIYEAELAKEWKRRNP